jgi:hypothetical protein
MYCVNFDFLSFISHSITALIFINYILLPNLYFVFQNYALETLIADSTDLGKLTVASSSQSDALSSSPYFSPLSSYSRYVSPQNESSFLFGKSLLFALDDDNYEEKRDSGVVSSTPLRSCVLDDSFGCSAQIERHIDNDMDQIQMQALNNIVMCALEFKSNNDSVMLNATPNSKYTHSGSYVSQRRGNTNWSRKSSFSSNKSSQLKLRIYNKRNRYQSQKSPQSKLTRTSIRTNSNENVNLELLKVDLFLFILSYLKSTYRVQIINIMKCYFLFG